MIHEIRLTSYANEIRPSGIFNMEILALENSTPAKDYANVSGATILT